MEDFNVEKRPLVNNNRNSKNGSMKLASNSSSLKETLESNNSITNSLIVTSSPTRESSPTPQLSSSRDNVENNENTEFSDDSDDELQDWSLLNTFSKKGMKDLEPLLTDSDYNQLSEYDQHKLNKARNMRFNALTVKRGSIVNLENLKASTIYINLHDHQDLFMLQPKGKFLETMGFIDKQNICHFGFEEVLYLVERGSCMLKFWDKSNDENNNIYESMPPLSLQSVYSLLIKNEDQLNQYLVFSILKRDGYIITRHEEFNGQVSNNKTKLFESHEDIFKNLQLTWWTKLLMNVSEFFKLRFPFKLAFSYYNIFTYLHSKILKQSMPQVPKLENVNKGRKYDRKHTISFNIWKPSPNFKKKNPPPPDYQITILKAAEKLPRYGEIKSLIERSCSNPETYKPRPKFRNGKNGKNDKNNNDGSNKSDKNGKDDKDINGDKSNRILETAWDYTKGIDMNNLKFNPNRITFAIVDNTTVNFITLSHCSFVSEGVIWRDHWVTWRPPVKKKRQSSNKNHKNHKGLFNPNITATNSNSNNDNNNNNNNNNKIAKNKLLTEPPVSAHF